MYRWAKTGHTRKQERAGAAPRKVVLRSEKVHTWHCNIFSVGVQDRRRWNE